ncbi:MAG: site-specific integrase [Oscillospiraceae bacterium]|nr:site-specific integrase [Oscillospiraceae bacterium]
MASIEQKDSNTYIVTVSAGRGRKVKRNWHPQEGWSRKTTERELQKFAADLENQLESGALQTRSERLAAEAAAKAEAAKIKTLAQYANGVFMPAKSVVISENSRAGYQRFLDNHILPVLGDFALPEISSAMITKLLLDFQKSHAHASCVKLYNILNGVFSMAFLDESIQQNPMLRVQRPKPRKDEQAKEQTAYTAEETRYILQCLENEPLQWRCYVNLLLDSGARRGEICALEWSDIDFKGGTITISKNLQYTSAAGVYIDTPKSGKSRIVDIGDTTLNLLRALRRQQAAECISKFVFTQHGSAEVMHPQTPTRYFQKFGKRYGIEDFHPHKLRHTSASLALTNGADVVSTSERLGHADTSITLKMYAHSNPEAVRNVGDIVRNVLKAENE